MACYHPVTAWRTDDGTVVFAERGKISKQITIKCGQCRGCRLDRSRQWAARCLHESKMHKAKCFITLTYNNENIPQNNQLIYKQFQKFIRKLRKQTKLKIRYYAAGEYGEQLERPHFHACLFGIDFPDKKYHAKTPAGFKIYTSETLDKAWHKGFASIGDLTFETAAYTARYIMKKITGGSVIDPHTLEKWYNDKTSKNIKEMYYKKINLTTGEIYNQNPEFNQMSRKPGIGSTWLEKYKEDVYPEGKIIIRGHLTNAPRYYDNKYKELDPLGHEALEYSKYIEGQKQAHDNTPERLLTKEIVKEAQIKQLKRIL